MRLAVCASVNAAGLLPAFFRRVVVARGQSNDNCVTENGKLSAVVVTMKLASLGAGIALSGALPPLCKFSVQADWLENFVRDEPHKCFCLPQGRGQTKEKEQTEQTENIPGSQGVPTTTTGVATHHVSGR